MNSSGFKSGQSNILQWFKAQNTVLRFIIINVTAFLLISVIRGLFHVDLQQPGSALNTLLAVPSDGLRLLTHPWTLFTYMFVHYDLSHIFFNMLWLYWFGRIFTEYLSEKQFVAVYILGGLCGAVLYVVSYNLFPRFEFIRQYAYAIGASASIMAVVVAISFHVPNYLVNLIFLGPVKIKYIAIGTFVIDLLMINSDNSGGHLAHIGGAIFGYVFIKQLSKGRDLSYVFSNLKRYFFTQQNTHKRSGTKFKVRTGGGQRSVSDEEYNQQRSEHQAKIDAILDKISKSGYESLTREEKELLFNASDKK